MKNGLLLVVKGFVMGIANLVPGVSGGTIALTLGIYHEFVRSLGRFFGDFKRSVTFLLPVGAGILLSLLTMSGVIEASFAVYPLFTAMFFSGLVAGGIPEILAESGKTSYKFSDITAFAVALLLVFGMAAAEVFSLNGLNGSTDGIVGFVMLFVAGALTAATMVVPGVSGSLLLLLLGYYDTVIAALSDLASLQNLQSSITIMAAFGLGLPVGLVGMSRLIEHLFNRYRTTSMSAVKGFMFSSVVALPIVALNGVTVQYSTVNIAIAALLFCAGGVVAYLLGKQKSTTPSVE